jgi:hypothetical protein
MTTLTQDAAMDATLDTAAKPTDEAAIRAKSRRRRNGSAIGAVGVYTLANLIGLTMLRSPSPFAYHHWAEIYTIVDLLGFAMCGFYVAFCCFGAKARGWSGWAGVPIAFVGLLFWFGAAAYLLYQNVNVGWHFSNEPRVYDDRLRMLIFVAFVVSAFTLLALPNRTGRSAAPTE